MKFKFNIALFFFAGFTITAQTYCPAWGPTGDDIENYVDNHMIPQMKDLVVRYTPDIIWTDGEWDKPSKDWKSEEFLAWLYNESPVKESVVVNDRCGSETRSKHGGIYTTEYGLVHGGEGIETEVYHLWEECSGIGISFGFNRTENLESYSSAEELIKILVSTLAAGGNLLLDIGTSADGTIPVIMQQRLMETGKWLEVNGEAIYGTRAYITNKNQESINPEVNKNMFFTKKGNDLYVILLNWPENNMILKGVKTRPSTKVSLLGSEKNVRLRSSGGNIIIPLPRLTPDDHQLAYVIKLSNL